MRRRHLTSRIPKNASGKRENETAGLSGELLIGDDFLVARLGLGTMRLTGPGIWGEPWSEIVCSPPLRPSRRLMKHRTVVEVKGSHAIFVSQPQAVASLIEKAAKGVQAITTR